MKCVYADWEKRNLGCNTVEFTVEKVDTQSPPETINNRIEEYLTEYQAEYLVVKADSKYPYISQYLQSTGFTLIESQIGIKFDREDVWNACEEYRDIFTDVSYKYVEDNSLDYVISEIKKGIFTTDRIALDPYFGIKAANKRYALWVEDEYKNGGKLFLSYHRKRPMGFFLDRELNNKSIRGLLGGLFTGEDNRNCGAMHIFAGKKSFLDRGLLLEKTSVSSNNPSILKLQLIFGGKISNIINVHIKHI